MAAPRHRLFPVSGEGGGSCGPPGGARRIEQCSGVGLPGLREHLADRTVLDNAARLHHGDMVADLADDGEIVTDQDHGHASLAMEVSQQGKNISLNQDVERRRGLVEEDDPRFGRKRAGDCNPLRLPTRQLVRIPGGVAAPKAHVFEQLIEAPSALRCSHAAKMAQGGVQGVSNRMARVERTPRVLEDELDLAMQRPARPVLPRQVDLAPIGPEQTGDDTGQGRLARTRLADEPEQAACGHVQVDTLQCRSPFRERFGDVTQPQQWCLRDHRGAFSRGMALISARV